MGLASAFVLCSMGFFVGEMRQAGNDGLLVLFTTLALYAAYRALQDDDSTSRTYETRRSPGLAGHWLGSRVWVLVFYAALGLGFLTKGPVILLMAGVTIVPYLTVTRRLRSGLSRLGDLAGLVILGALGPELAGRGLAK